MVILVFATCEVCQAEINAMNEEYATIDVGYGVHYMCQECR